MPLVLRLEIEATVERRLLPAEEVVSMTRDWQVAYDAIAERFVVTDAASGAHVSHATQAEALEALSRISGIVDRRHRDAARGRPLRHARARDRRGRRAAGGGAHAAVLEGLVAQHRVVRLEGAAMIRRWLPFVFGAGFVVWIAALVMLAMTAEGPQRFGELYLLILLVNVTGVIALLVLIGGRLADFVRDWRRHVPGSRLRGRTLLMFGGLAIAPLLLVFTFSVMFLTRGIDSWFHAEVRQGLTDALGLSRAALDLRMREYLERTVRIAGRLEGLSEGALYFALDDELRAAGAEEFVVTSAGGQPIAFSRAGMLHALPAVPPEDLLMQLRRGQPHVSLQPAPGGGYQVRAATTIRAGPGDSTLPAGRDLPGAAAAVRPRGHRAGGVPAVRPALVPARAAEGDVRADAFARAADGAARRRVRRAVLLRAAGAAGAGPDRGHARGRQGRLRHAPAARRRTTRSASSSPRSTT